MRRWAGGELTMRFGIRSVADSRALAMNRWAGTAEVRPVAMLGARGASRRTNSGRTLVRRSTTPIGVGIVLILGACANTATESPSIAATSEEPTAVASTSVSAAPSDSGSLPGGWKLVTVEDEGLSLALPKDWITASAQDLADAGVFEQLADENPEASAVLEQARQLLESGQLSFLALETGNRTVETGFAANMNVVFVADPGSSTPEQIAAQMAFALPVQIPGLEVLNKDTTVLPAGDAAVVEATWTLIQGGRKLPLRLIQYLVLVADSAYVLSFTVPDKNADLYDDIWQVIVESFRVE
jgi:hypothetical protein